MPVLFNQRSFTMQGLLSGYEVVVSEGSTIYKIKIAEGVRGMNIPVTVTHIGKIWTVSLEGKQLTVEEVLKAVFKKVTNSKVKSVPTANRFYVEISVNGKAFAGEISPETSFMAGLMSAEQRGKNPIDALAFLADTGLSNVHRPEYDTPRINKMGS